FGIRENAEAIRAIYIEQIMQCDDNEADFKANEDGLDSEQHKAREKNLALKCALMLEWYYIHSNNPLGVDNIRPIVTKRLAEIARKEYQQLQRDLRGEEGRLITDRVNQLVISLKTNLSPNESPSPTTQQSNSETPGTTQAAATPRAAQPSAAE